MFSEMEMSYTEAGKIELENGNNPSAYKVTLGYKPKKIWIRSYCTTSGTASANGFQAAIYDEDISTTTYKWLGNEGWYDNTSLGSAILAQVNDDGFTIGSYNTLSTLYWWVQKPE